MSIVFDINTLLCARMPQENRIPGNMQPVSGATPVKRIPPCPGLQECTVLLSSLSSCKKNLSYSYQNHPQ